MTTPAAHPRATAARVSVIVPTYNRWDEARVSLACLLRSDYADFEVVLVEDGCTDGTAESAQDTRLADTGSFDTTPYIVGGTAFLALGAYSFSKIQI